MEKVLQKDLSRRQYFLYVLLSVSALLSACVGGSAIDLSLRTLGNEPNLEKKVLRIKEKANESRN
jgi:hypothetical protein